MSSDRTHLENPHLLFKVSPIFPSEAVEVAYLEGLKEQAGLDEEIGKLVEASRRLVFASVHLPFSLEQLEALARLLQHPKVAGSSFFGQMNLKHVVEGFAVLEVPDQPLGLDPAVNTFDKAVNVAVRNLVNHDMCPRGAGLIDPSVITESIMATILRLWEVQPQPFPVGEAEASEEEGEASEAEEEKEASEGEAGSEEEEEKEASEEEEEKEASEEEGSASEAEDSEEEEEEEEAEPSEEEGLVAANVRDWVVATYKPSARTSKRLNEIINKVLAEDTPDRGKLNKISQAVLRLDKRQLTSVDYRKLVDAYLGE